MLRLTLIQILVLILTLHIDFRLYIFELETTHLKKGNTQHNRSLAGGIRRDESDSDSDYEYYQLITYTPVRDPCACMYM